MKNKLFTYLAKHKAKILLLCVVLGGGYYYYATNKSVSSAPKYTLTTVESGAIVKTVSGSGQVSNESQFEVKPKVSADLSVIKVKEGQKVKAGDVLFQLDDSDLKTKVREAKNSLDQSRASLSLKLASLTKEELAVEQKSLESSKLSYENAQTSLSNAERTAAESLKKSELSLENSQLSLANAKTTYENALQSSGLTTDSDNQDLSNAQEDAQQKLSALPSALRTAVILADGILEENKYNNSTHSFRNLLAARDPATLTMALSSYGTAESLMKSFQTDYDLAAIDWQKAEIKTLLDKGVVASQATKKMETDLYLALVNTVDSGSLTQSLIDSYKSSVSSQESNMLSQVNSLQSAKQAIVRAELGQSSGGVSITGSLSNAKTAYEKAKNELTAAENSLAQTKLDNKKNIDSAKAELKSRQISYESAQAQFAQKMARPRDIDLASSRLQVAQAAENYQQAVNDLESAQVKSPIDGVVADISAVLGDAVSPSASMATIVTTKKLALMSFNETDAAKLKTGQKATLTFSALEDLTIAGSVVEVGTLGTTNQGVVSYEVKISLDTEDENIKSQMSVSASVITDQSVGVLVLPSSAVKTDASGASYVELMSTTDLIDGKNQPSESAKTPTRQTIEIGLSDDTNTEIKSGLSVGTEVVLKTVTAQGTASGKTTTQQSGLNMLGGAGGGMRMR